MFDRMERLHRELSDVAGSEGSIASVIIYGAENPLGGVHVSLMV